MRVTWNTAQVGKITPLLFWQRGANYHWSQATSISIQKRCSHIVAVYTVHIVKNSAV